VQDYYVVVVPDGLFALGQDCCVEFTPEIAGPGYWYVVIGQAKYVVRPGYYEPAVRFWA